MKNQIFLQRQEKLLASLQEEAAICIWYSGTQKVKGLSYHYPAAFRAQRDFYYLCGGCDAEAFLILQKKGSQFSRFIYYKQQTLQEKRWSDHQTWGSDLHDCADHGYDEIKSYGAGEESSLLSKFLNSSEKKVYLHQSAAEILSLSEESSCSRDLGLAVARLRIIKDRDEQMLMQEATYRSALAHRDLALNRYHIGLQERHWQAAWLSYGAKYGLDHQGYRPIMAGGQRGCCLHYQANNQSLKSENRILIDAGFEFEGYCADITRVYFFDKTALIYQDIYQRFLVVQKKIIDAVKPGRTLKGLQLLAQQEIAQLLRDFGWAAGSVESIMTTKLVDYYPHQVSHHLGLDVHDITAYRELYTDCLEPGMIITIEPGLYLDPAILEAHHPFLGLALRIEDDILVTEEGHHNLTLSAPKEWKDVGVL